MAEPIRSTYVIGSYGLEPCPDCGRPIEQVECDTVLEAEPSALSLHHTTLTITLRAAAFTATARPCGHLLASLGELGAPDVPATPASVPPRAPEPDWDKVLRDLWAGTSIEPSRDPMQFLQPYCDPGSTYNNLGAPGADHAPILRPTGPPRDPDDLLPRRGRNPRIGCEQLDGTWIHGRPHDCPRWARR